MAWPSAPESSRQHAINRFQKREQKRVRIFKFTSFYKKFVTNYIDKINLACQCPKKHLINVNLKGGGRISINT